LKKIQEKNKPHVTQNTGDNEWYTPSEYIKAARKVMGTIDLDPATSKIANEIVKADKIFTINDNGLDKKWFGNVFLNPPYSSDLVSKFIDKLINELKNINQCILLVNNATDTTWFQKIVIHSTAVCFPKGRIKFYKPNSNKCAPLQGQCILYFGNKYSKFTNEFSKFGWCILNGKRKN
jgi:phage N-6-adenine-methyltransferase